MNEIKDARNDNSDFNYFVKVSEPKFEDCENSFEDSEVKDPVNYIGLIEPKIENCDRNSLENFELEDPLSTNSVHEEKNVFQCNVCISGFKYKTSLLEHINTVHEKNKAFKPTNNKEIIKEYSCNSKGCEKSFSKKTNLNRHIQTVHNKIMQFSCPSCKTTFGAKQVMKRHLLKCERKYKNKTKKLKKQNTSEDNQIKL